MILLIFIGAVYIVASTMLLLEIRREVKGFRKTWEKWRLIFVGKKLILKDK